MALFRRRSLPEEAPAAAESHEPAPDTAGPEGDADQAEAGPPREPGPFDQAEIDLADQSFPRLDLVSLLVPGLPGIGIQVEADPETQQVRAVTAVAQDGAVQIQAFAAPRSLGIWDEIRAEMLSELSATSGARVEEGEGAFGPELRAVVPARSPDGKQVRQALRFTGIDGPRWFVRAVFLGRAAVDPDPADSLHQLVRQLVVVRGDEAMAPRDPLPLRLPEAPPEGMGPGADPAGDESDGGSDGDGDESAEGRFADIDPFERGPEITEVR